MKFHRATATNRCCCSTPSSLGLWKQSSRALDFLWQVVRSLTFISLLLALPQEPCWTALVSRSWHGVQEATTEHPKTVHMKAARDEEKLFLKEWVYLSRAQTITKCQGQAPYNCPLQYFYRPPWSTCTALYWWQHLKENFLCSIPAFVSAIVMNLCFIFLFQLERRQEITSAWNQHLYLNCTAS